MPHVKRSMGEIIRDYLTMRMSATSHELWRHLVEEAAREHRKSPKKTQVQSYVWRLKRLGLLVLVDEDEPEGDYRARGHYGLAAGRVHDRGWRDPYGALYPGRRH